MKFREAVWLVVLPETGFIGPIALFDFIGRGEDANCHCPATEPL